MFKYFSALKISAAIFLRNFSLSNRKIYNRRNSWHISPIAEWLRAKICWRSAALRISQILNVFLLTRKFVCLAHSQRGFLLRVFFLHIFKRCRRLLACFQAFSIYLHVVIWRLRSIDRAFSYRREEGRKNIKSNESEIKTDTVALKISGKMFDGSFLSQNELQRGANLLIWFTTNLSLTKSTQTCETEVKHN